MVENSCSEHSVPYVPRMLTIRQVAATGILPEHALRMMQKNGTLPCVMAGCKALVNYDKLLEKLQQL